MKSSSDAESGKQIERDMPTTTGDIFNTLNIRTGSWDTATVPSSVDMHIYLLTYLLQSSIN